MTSTSFLNVGPRMGGGLLKEAGAEPRPRASRRASAHYFFLLSPFAAGFASGQ
jgi:hypothetical protein